ncbi:winged helix DNA-binding domain-containing protein [Glycomyces sp. L485]|uniref:winged helix DNA-binding domain-containing protein n=1 Tax=Glycomyces sp. L485 TaxID=2909235 RepID=UPI001F4A729B|nr:winged helix DNA-binding domain-containing protein [Glycomyces sp. L485]MCH7229410.1 winged helix DNA-binding domain-containing protein [Glycomyces sp. L485]
MEKTSRRTREFTPGEIAAWRARSQRLWGEKWRSPLEAFAHLGAVQSQEYHPSKLTPAMRTAPADGAFAPASAVDALIEDGTVVRTHVLRTTWHTVPATDLRMMLSATADRTLRVLGSMTRGLGLDEPTLARCDEILAEGTARGRHLTRDEAAAELAAAGIEGATGQRLGHILMHAEFTAAICSGAPKGKQQTYANFDERVPAGRIGREDAIRELARRFYASRGPATLKDFTRWASLTVADAKAAIGDLDLESIEIDGRICYLEGEAPAPREDGLPVVDFVQGFDEMMCSYTDTRDWVIHSSIPRSAFPERPRFNSAILLDGQIIGHWKATVRAKKVQIDSYRLRGFTAAEIAAMRRGADRLRAWYGKDEMELGLDHA